MATNGEEPMAIDIAEVDGGARAPQNNSKAQVSQLTHLSATMGLHKCSLPLTQPLLQCRRRGTQPRSAPSGGRRPRAEERRGIGGQRLMTFANTQGESYSMPRSAG